MTIVIYLVKQFFFTTLVNRIVLIGELGLIGIAGMAIFLVISHFTGLLDEVLGKDFLSKILSKFKRGKKNEK